MKLFLSTDIEGTSGIVAWEQIIEGNAEYEQGRRLLTNEVNAVISGALEAGSAEFVVNDSHHYMRNLHPQEGASRAVRNVNNMRPPMFQRPVSLEVTLLVADMAEMALWVRGVERVGPRTIVISSENLLDLYRMFVTVVTLTRSLVDH